ncbi:Fc.00g028750.m01.CDS01 [Cosmosporella sp. VM-42]
MAFDFESLMFNSNPRSVTVIDDWNCSATRKQENFNIYSISLSFVSLPITMPRVPPSSDPDYRRDYIKHQKWRLSRTFESLQAAQGPYADKLAMALIRRGDITVTNLVEVQYVGRLPLRVTETAEWWEAKADQYEQGYENIKEVAAKLQLCARKPLETDVDQWADGLAQQLRLDSIATAIFDLGAILEDDGVGGQEGPNLPGLRLSSRWVEIHRRIQNELKRSVVS